jgi:Fe-S oxidoreductase
LPAFAQATFRSWWRSRKTDPSGEPEQARKVLLWVDTFNNHFQPQVLIAATEVLESAGYRVLVTEQALCCGRPLYDYGLLKNAKRYLRQILETLRPHLEAGIPIVGLEPSCVAVFRDELCNLFPDDKDARALAEHAFLLDELLTRDGSSWEPPRLERKALVHGHCHHKAIMQLDAQAELLERVGLDADILDSGCCGMAGGFGYERDHYDVSRACGERVLLPAVRRAPGDTLLIADGFSCREQIRQETQREALHVAQVLQMAARCATRRKNGAAAS